MSRSRRRRAPADLAAGRTGSAHTPCGSGWPITARPLERRRAAPPPGFFVHRVDRSDVRATPAASSSVLLRFQPSGFPPRMRHESPSQTTTSTMNFSWATVHDFSLQVRRPDRHGDRWCADVFSTAGAQQRFHRQNAPLRYRSRPSTFCAPLKMMWFSSSASRFAAYIDVRHFWWCGLNCSQQHRR